MLRKLFRFPFSIRIDPGIQSVVGLIGILPKRRSTACGRRQDAAALRIVTRARPDAPGAVG